MGKIIIDLGGLEIPEFLFNEERKVRKKTVGSYCLQRRDIIPEGGEMMISLVKRPRKIGTEDVACRKRIKLMDTDPGGAIKYVPEDVNGGSSVKWART